MDEGFATGFLAGQDSGGGGGGNDMFGGSGIWGLLALVLILGAFNGGGFGGFGGGGGRGGPATQADVRDAIDNQTLISKIDQQTYGIADSFTALNGAITSGFYGVDKSVCDLSHQISDCCCTTQRSIDNVRFDMSKGFCDLGNMMHNNTRDITDTIRDGFARVEAQANARYIADLERKLNNCDRDSALQGLGTYLINTLRPCPVPAYITCNPYASVYSGGGNYGSGCGCGC